MARETNTTASNEGAPPALTTDEELLASLGYKQEFKREFTKFEVFGVAFSIIGLLPSIACVRPGPSERTSTDNSCQLRTIVRSAEWRAVRHGVGCAFNMPHYNETD